MQKAKAKKPTGYIIYRGPSLLDGKPIVVVAIIKESKNSKTGNLVQTYILADNGKSPVESTKTLEDVSVCGDCKHRRGLGGACYVNLGQGARAVMDGIMRGIYPVMPAYEVARLIAGRKVRLGTYGDPMAVPYMYWVDLVRFADDHTGYSHQWNNPTFLNADVDSILYEHYQGIRELCMASVDSEDERVLAGYERWRTFRVRSSVETKTDRKTEAVLREITCPASEEAGKKKQCSDCMACDGVGVGEQRFKRPDIVITVHGSLKKRFHDAQAFVG